MVVEKTFKHRNVFMTIAITIQQSKRRYDLIRQSTDCVMVWKFAVLRGAQKLRCENNISGSNCHGASNLI